MNIKNFSGGHNMNIKKLFRRSQYEYKKAFQVKYESKKLSFEIFKLESEANDKDWSGSGNGLSRKRNETMIKNTFNFKFNFFYL